MFVGAKTASLSIFGFSFRRKASAVKNPMLKAVDSSRFSSRHPSVYTPEVKPPPVAHRTMVEQVKQCLPVKNTSTGNLQRIISLSEHLE